MPHQADDAQVQEGGLSALPHPGGGLGRRLVDSGWIASVGGEVLQAGAVAVGGLDPAGRGADADPDPVVLADQQERQGKTLVGAVAGRVDRTGRRGVIGRGVAEAGDDHGVRRPSGGYAEAGRAVDRERDPDGTGQMRANRRGLRDHREGLAAEHLVAAARDGLVRGADHAQQGVPDGVLPGNLTGPLGEEGTGPVVQQRRVGRPQHGRDKGVGLMTRRSDRVEALSLATQHPRRQVEVPAGQLRPENLQAARPGQGCGLADRQRRRPQRLVCQRTDPVQETAVHRFVRRHPAQNFTALAPGQRRLPRAPHSRRGRDSLGRVTGGDPATVITTRCRLHGGCRAIKLAPPAAPCAWPGPHLRRGRPAPRCPPPAGRWSVFVECRRHPAKLARRRQ